MSGIRYQVLNAEKDPNIKRVEGRNAWKISTAGGWRRYFSVQAGNRREEGTRGKEQNGGRGRRSFSEHNKTTPKKLWVDIKEKRKESGVDKKTTWKYRQAAIGYTTTPQHIPDIYNNKNTRKSVKKEINTLRGKRGEEERGGVGEVRCNSFANIGWVSVL